MLYEMLAGRQTFEGETLSEVLAAVMTKEPHWEALPDTTPVAVQKLVRRCLHKDPKQRLQAIGEARIMIEEALSGVSGAAEAAETIAPATGPKTATGRTHGQNPRSEKA